MARSSGCSKTISMELLPCSGLQESVSDLFIDHPG